jgi:ATP adenylyltransferase
MGYILGKKPEGCVFCQALEADEEQASYIIHRGELVALMLNLYPYINGHLLVVPCVHVGHIDELDDRTLTEMMLVTRSAVRLLRRAMNPQGFNIGMNLGQAAGAGIQDHLHIHVVPRWENDTNFMPVLSDVRVIPESLDDTYHKLVQAARDEEWGTSTG